MRHVYCISGLGADHRIFCKLKLEEAELHFIEWISPIPGENISSYADRLKTQITHENPVLVGVSFGGIMAIELARILKLDTVVLISSIKSFTELPRWMKFCGKYKIDRILPKKPIREIPPLRLLRPVQNYFLGAKSKEEKKIANEYRDRVDPVYLKWSVNQVLNWQNDWYPVRTYHVHGDNDHIFPVRLVSPTHIIRNAGHFMVMNKCVEISAILNDILHQPQPTS